MAAAASLLVTFELFVEDAARGGVPMRSAEELSCMIAHEDASLSNAPVRHARARSPARAACVPLGITRHPLVQVCSAIVWEQGLRHVLAGGGLVPIVCPSPPALPPPPRLPPAPPAAVAAFALQSEAGGSAVAAVLAGVAGLLCCCVVGALCCTKLVARGFCGVRAQLLCTHSNPRLPPMYLPSEQRLTLRSHLGANCQRSTGPSLGPPARSKPFVVVQHSPSPNGHVVPDQPSPPDGDHVAVFRSMGHSRRLQLVNLGETSATTTQGEDARLPGTGVANGGTPNGHEIGIHRSFSLQATRDQTPQDAPPALAVTPSVWFGRFGHLELRRAR